MNKKFEAWCYGGVSKDFFMEQREAIHQYNSKMLYRLLLLLTSVFGVYIAFTRGADVFSTYYEAYIACFVALLLMLCTFKLKANKSNQITKLYIFLFSCVMFTFVCITGTIYDSDSRAILTIVYILALPMLFVVPTHHTYIFLTAATCVFSFMSLQFKESHNSYMDIAHGFTCLVLGFFLSHHILKSRMALYTLNAQLDAHNFRLGEQLQEKEQQLLQSRISILLSQIQPHFLYNTLTTICGLCDENPKEAKKVTAEFADYLRHNLETLNKNKAVPFSDELQHTEIYLSIEKKRFEERLNVIYHIDTMEFCVPALTMQPLVENAVKHGVLKRKKGGTVTISTRENADDYEITIVDDGVGFHPAQPVPDPYSHIGIENVRDRLWSICRGILTIESEVGSGTSATIQIPKGDTKR